MENIYSSNKVIYHPDILAKLKGGEKIYPTRIQLMPCNLCNHNCSFCNYRLENNVNTELFDQVSQLPLPILERTLADFKDMGGKAIEITGGGEPLLYRHSKDMFKIINEHELEYALITNGVLITEKLAELMAPNMTWARISIDAGNPETYSKIRRAPKEHFFRALEGIILLKRYSQKEDFKLGIGFVINNDNYKEIYDLCELAREHGADNVRLSTIFHPDNMQYFDKDVVQRSKDIIERCKNLNDENFKVYNNFNDRISNIIKPFQDYNYCGMKDIVCVVGGDSKVYTCCTLAFHRNGEVGNLKDTSLKELWDSSERVKMYSEFNPRVKCRIKCLHESKNRFINDILFNDPLHRNFI